VKKKKEYTTKFPDMYKSPITQLIEHVEELAQLKRDFPEMEEGGDLNVRP
jgi:hypothetical protein